MIGLSFLAVGLLWLTFSWYFSTRLPKWLGITKVAWQWVLSAAVFLVLMIGPFLDHIVGMRQFRALCDEQTDVWINPKAVNSKHARYAMSRGADLLNYAVKITKYEITYVDLETDAVIARYNYFSTNGGRIGGLLRLGNPFDCSAEESSTRDFQKLTAFKRQLTIK